MDQHFYNGFIKRAQDYGLSVVEADRLIKAADGVAPEQVNESRFIPALSTAELDKNHADVSQRISDAEAFHRDLLHKSSNPEFSTATQNKYTQMAKGYKPQVDELYRTRTALTASQNAMAQRNKHIDELNGVVRSAGGLLGGSLLRPEDIEKHRTAIMNGEWDSTPSSQSATPAVRPQAPAVRPQAPAVRPQDPAARPQAPAATSQSPTFVAPAGTTGMRTPYGNVAMPNTTIAARQQQQQQLAEQRSKFNAAMRGQAANANWRGPGTSPTPSRGWGNSSLGRTPSLTRR